MIPGDKKININILLKEVTKMKGYKLTKRGENVLLTLEIIGIAILVIFFAKATMTAWEKEYEINSHISTQAAQSYYESLPHSK